MLDKRKADAQEVLDELWNGQQIPFSLSVGQITKSTHGYTIHFFDSRIFTANVPWIKGQDFKAAVRSAVLTRVARMGGPLTSRNA